jgi:N-sulfoglucosamine sulfohydrolase
MKPNLILIHTHDTGRYLGCYGAPVPTPNFVRFAKEGVLFRQAFCASPNCSPSRVSLLTGLMPHNHGMIGLCHRGFRMSDPKKHLSHLLRNEGYHTQLIGYQHEVMKGEENVLGYDHVIPESDLKHMRHSAKRAKLAVDWLQQKPREPFFLNVGFVETHRPFGALEAPEDERYVGPMPWLPDAPGVRKDVAELNTVVRHVDEALGLILDAVDRLGYANNTLVIFTTDHGVPFPRAKATLFDVGIGVSLLMRGPGGFTGGKVVDSLVSHLDVIPTFFEMAQMTPPNYLEGKSLLPIMSGQKNDIHEELFAELSYHGAYDPARSVRTSRYKYIRFFEDRPRLMFANTDAGSAKEYLAEQGLPIGERPRELLFDLVADPQEVENVAEWPEHRGVKEELSAKLDQWMVETNDPLRSGKMPAPESIKLTPHHWYSSSQETRDSSRTASESN